MLIDDIHPWTPMQGGATTPTTARAHGATSLPPAGAQGVPQAGGTKRALDGEDWHPDASRRCHRQTDVLI
jgi:hypothetical protein